MTDTRALLQAADEQDPEFGALLRVLAATGPRRGEVCGLRWSDIDTVGGTVYIRRSVASVSGGTIVKDTKTHAARRIAIDADTLSVLASHRARMEARAAACAMDLPPAAFMFTSTGDGAEPLHPDTITGGFQRLCRRVGMPGVRLHDLRHLHATQLLAAGVPVRTVSGRLGDADAATTLNVYAHFLEASDRQAADVIGGLLDAGRSTRPLGPLLDRRIPLPEPLHLRAQPVPAMLVVVLLAEATPQQFARVRRHFKGPIANPGWAP